VPSLVLAACNPGRWGFVQRVRAPRRQNGFGLIVGIHAGTLLWDLVGWCLKPVHTAQAFPAARKVLAALALLEVS
jgi:hypothetical protein